MKEQKLNKKNNKGITLIALIITIVVLLILAVVSIGAIRESSIITHAQNAKESWKKSQTQEELELKLAELKIDMGQNPSNYEFKMILEDDEKFEGDDEGLLNKIFSSIGLTITGLDADKKFKFNENSLEHNIENVQENDDDTECFLCSYNIPCVDKNNEEVMVNIKFTMLEHYTEDEEILYYLCNITQMSVLGELGKAINTINEKIINNPSDYQISGQDGEGALNIIYTALMNENITIESTELLNSEKNGFSIEVFGDENNTPLETISTSLYGSTVAFDCNCSKGGETLTVRPIFGIYFDDDTREWYTRVPIIKIK